MWYNPLSELTREHVERYMQITCRALDKISISLPERSGLRKMADDFHIMATAYYKDAVHFLEKGDIVNAFACINYAHGWIDSGARLGFFDVGDDDQLFTLYE